MPTLPLPGAALPQADCHHHRLGPGDDLALLGLACAAGSAVGSALIGLAALLWRLLLT